LFIICLICICSFGCNERKNVNYVTDAKVLSVNENIVRGKLIGDLLSSPDGKIRNDVIIVGISVDRPPSLGGGKWLLDVKLKHAELAYYKNSTSIPIHVKGHINPEAKTVFHLSFHLNGREIYKLDSFDDVEYEYN
jgi:hypothetical protein